MIWGGFNGGSGHEAPSYQFFFVGTEQQYRAYADSPEAQRPHPAGEGPTARLPRTGSTVPLRGLLMTSPPPNMALQRTRRPSLRSSRSLRSLGSPLNAYPLGVGPQ